MKKFYPLLFSILILLFVISISKCFSIYFFLQLTDSMPKGIYLRKKIPEKIEVGDIIVFRPPYIAKKLIYNRGWYLFKKKYNLIKQVMAVEGDEVKINLKDGLLINNKYVGPVCEYDSKGLPLPVFKGKFKILKNEIFFVSSYCKNSFDSRYFGPVKKNSLIGIAIPFIVFDS